MRECPVTSRPIPPRLLADLEAAPVARASDYAVVQWGDSDRYLVHHGDGLGDQPKSERALLDANDWDGPFNSLKSALSWVEECERADAWGSADDDAEVQLPEPPYLDADGPMEPQSVGRPSPLPMGVAEAEREKRWNPRYIAYAKSQGCPVDRMWSHDGESGHLFSEWIMARWAEWAAIGDNRKNYRCCAGWIEAGHVAFDAWLSTLESEARRGNA